MLSLPRVLYPSDEGLAAISQLAGVQLWRLEESFRPSRPSQSLHQPLSCLTPDLTIDGCQWLIQAPRSAGVTLQSGLLRLGQRCIYESNRSNTDPMARRLRRAGSLPPGWWHGLREPTDHQQSLLFLSTHNNPNYFHWMTQPGLAPLFLQDHFGLDSPSGTSLGLSHRPRSSLPTYVPSLLAAIAPEFSIACGVSLRSDTFCRFAVHQYTSGVWISPAQLHWLNRRCLTCLQPLSKPWRRVFVSRKRSTRRRCLNEDQLFAALAEYGFELYTLDDLSVIEQFRLFSECSLIVGVHGAAFSNIVACQPQASVVELIPRPGDFSHYYAIASVLGLRHAHLLASSCHHKTDDFIIPPDDLLSLLREMMLL